MLPAAILALTLAPAADPADDLARVLAGWERRQKAVQTARFELTWELVPIVGPPRRQAVGQIADGSMRIDIDLTNNWWRLDTVMGRRRVDRPDDLSQLGHSLRFDGRTFTLGRMQSPTSEPATNNGATIDTGRAVQWAAVMWKNSDTLPVLWGLGRPFTQRDVYKIPTLSLLPPLARDRFTVSGTEVVDGRRCLVLSDGDAPNDQPEQWVVDPDRDGAVVRYRATPRSGGTFEVSVRYTETPHGWLPAEWGRDGVWPHNPDSDGVRYRMSVRSVNEVIPVSEFQQTFTAGDKVFLNDIPHTVRSDGTFEMDPAYAKAVSRAAFKERMLAMLRDPVIWVIAGLFTLLFAVAIVWRIIRSGRRMPAAE